jgi:hypothetical protein
VCRPLSDEALVIRLVLTPDVEDYTTLLSPASFRSLAWPAVGPSASRASPSRS